MGQTLADVPGLCRFWALGLPDVPASLLLCIDQNLRIMAMQSICMISSPVFHKKTGDPHNNRDMSVVSTVTSTNTEEVEKAHKLAAVTHLFRKPECYFQKGVAKRTHVWQTAGEVTCL